MSKNIVISAVEVETSSLFHNCKPAIEIKHINIMHTTQEGSSKNHHETQENKVSALISEHGETSTDHNDNDDQSPMLLLQSEEKGEHEDEDNAGRLGDSVEGHIYVLKTPLG